MGLSLRWHNALLLIAVAVISARVVSSQIFSAPVGESSKDFYPCGAPIHSSQLPLVTTSSGSNQLYFTATILPDTLQEFHFVVTALDGKPLGFKQVYDFDADDEMNAFDCYPSTTVDDTTCDNSFMSIGQRVPVFPGRSIRLVLERCAAGSMGTLNEQQFSTDFNVEMYARDTGFNSNVARTTACTGFQRVSKPEPLCVY